MLNYEKNGPWNISVGNTINLYSQGMYFFIEWRKSDVKVNIVGSDWLGIFSIPGSVLKNFKHLPPYLAGWWRFPGALHCHYGKADC